jgi:hypothetical protein
MDLSSPDLWEPPLLGALCSPAFFLLDNLLSLSYFLRFSSWDFSNFHLCLFNLTFSTHSYFSKGSKVSKYNDKKHLTFAHWLTMSKNKIFAGTCKLWLTCFQTMWQS